MHLLGHSFGGQIAQLCAARIAEGTRRLTLPCTRATPFPPFADMAQAREQNGLHDPDAVLARWFPPEALAADAAPVRYVRSCLLEADPVVWAAELRMIAEYDGRDALRAITAPTSVIAAEHDHLVTPEAMTDMAGLLHRARFHLLPGSYHLAPSATPRASLLSPAERNHPPADEHPSNPRPLIPAAPPPPRRRAAVAAAGPAGRRLCPSTCRARSSRTSRGRSR